MKRGRPKNPDVLTPREHEVLALISDGLTNEEIASRLGISESGARFHVSEILSRLGVSRRHEAARWYRSSESGSSLRGLLLPVGALKLASVGVISAVVLAFVALAVGVGLTESRAPKEESAIQCAVTEPNGSTPPGENSSPGHHGNGTIWTGLWPNGEVILEAGGPGSIAEDGSLEMKWWWWRSVAGPLEIEGQRLDADVAPLRASIPDGYAAVGFQVAALIFASPGCWEVTGTVGSHSLTFVTLVTRR